MNSKQIKGGLCLIAAALLLFYTGSVYRAGGFGVAFSVVLCLSILVVSPLILCGYRRLGSVPAWLMLAVSAFLIYYGSRDAATTLLIWSLCCGVALSVSLFWPGFRKIRPLTQYALPVAGIVWVAGAFGYCKLHFGAWELSEMAHRISHRYVGFLNRGIAEIEAGTLKEYAEQAFEYLKEFDFVIGFTLILMVAYLLFGSFFLSVYLADHTSEGRWLGSWKTLIPGPGLSFVFMLLHFAGLLMNVETLRTLTATLNLFGFFYVFTALYRLHCWMRKKGVNPHLRRLAVGALFALSYFSVGNSLLSVYTIAMYIGWWMASAPQIKTIR